MSDELLSVREILNLWDESADKPFVMDLQHVQDRLVDLYMRWGVSSSAQVQQFREELAEIIGGQEAIAEVLSQRKKEDEQAQADQ
jgi:hypothetical protein